MKKGNSLSVSIRLVSAEDGRILWTSQNFERPLNKSYELQNLISCNVANELGAELCSTLAKNLHRSTSSAEAFQAYLRGRYQWNKRTAKGIEKSIDYYNEAISFDPNYALAYAGLAESYVQGIWHVPFIAKEVLPKAKEAALKAVELDDGLSEAHTALGNVFELNWDWPEAERELKRAVELNPRNARAHHVLAFHFLTLGLNDEAFSSIEKARELDPLNLVINTDKANILFTASRVDEAFKQWDTTLEFNPNFALAYLQRSIANESMGNESAAIEDWANWLEFDKKSANEVSEFRQIAAKSGMKGFHRKELSNYLAREKRGENVPLIAIAIYNSILGNRDDAFKNLEKCFNSHVAELVLLKPDARFNALRSDQRYQDILRQMGLPE